MASRIVAQIDRIPHRVYAEPFAGGLAVLFAKGLPVLTDNDHYREAINDTNRHLITLYRVVKTAPQELFSLIDATLYSRADHASAKAILRSPANYTDIEIAWAFFIGVNCSFANNLFSGWSTATSGRNHAATLSNKIDRLRSQMERFRSVYIDCQDALSFIDVWDSEGTLFYCDPPYPGADQGHYSGYTAQDWAALCDRLDNIKGSYVLSNYAQEVELKSAQQRIEIAASSSASNGSKGTDRARTEILWICNRQSGDALCPQIELNLAGIS